MIDTYTNSPDDRQAVTTRLVFAAAVALFAALIGLSLYFGSQEDRAASLVPGAASAVTAAPVDDSEGVDPSAEELPQWDGGEPWGEGDQFEWEAQTGLRPVPIGLEWGVMLSADQDRNVAADPFGVVPVYRYSAGGSLGEQIGVWTQVGSFDLATATGPDFDVRAMIEADQGPNYVYYLEHQDELTCEQTRELLGDGVVCGEPAK